MKWNFPPLWISLSIVTGLFTLAYSTQFFYRQTNFPGKEPTILNKQDSLPVIKLISHDSMTIDTILLGKNFYARQDTPDVATVTDRLENINTKGLLNLNPAIFKWIIFHCVTLSLVTASSYFILFLVLQIWPDKREIISIQTLASIVIALLAVLVYILAFIKDEAANLMNGIEIQQHFRIIFKDPHCAITYITRIMQIIGFIPVLGMLLINLRTYYVFQQHTTSATYEEYIKLKSSLNLFALYLGLLVSCAVIGTGLQRDMVLTQVVNGDLVYNKEMIYAYGIAYSLVLALFFIPSFLYLRVAANKIVSAPPDEIRNVRTDWWKISSDTIDNLKLALAIVLPVVSSIVQPLLT